MELDEITYQAAKKSLNKIPELLEQQRKTLTDMGVNNAQIEKALAPTFAFIAGICEDITRYENQQKLKREKKEELED